MVNLAEPLLGGLYDTLNGAFGSQAAWLLGHLLLAAVGLGLIALARNWSEIVNGAELRRSHATDALLFCIVTGFQVQMYHNTMAWPLFSSILIAGTFTLSLGWCVKVLN